jgi:hypothetical protein
MCVMAFSGTPVLKSYVVTVNTGSRPCTVSRLVIARADVQIDGDTYRASGMWRSAEERGALVFYPLTHDVEAHPGTPAARELGALLLPPGRRIRREFARRRYRLSALASRRELPASAGAAWLA